MQNCSHSVYRLQTIAQTGIALVIMIAFCFVPAGCVVYIVHERVTREKRLQYTCGVGVFLYWLTAFLWDWVSTVM